MHLFREEGVFLIQVLGALREKNFEFLSKFSETWQRRATDWVIWDDCDHFDDQRGPPLESPQPLETLY
jgi:hypothetical protein